MERYLEPRQVCHQPGGVVLWLGIRSGPIAVYDPRSDSIRDVVDRPTDKVASEELIRV